MTPILNLNNPLQVNTLFLQPTRWCALNCAGCYVKEHSGGPDGYHTPVYEQAKLIRYYLENNLANQITVSMDNFDVSTQLSMRTLYDHILFLIENVPSMSTEVHMTFHNLNTFIKYIDHTESNFADAELLDVISFSNIKESDYKQLIILADKTHINYNHLVPSNVTSFNIDKYVQHITEIGEIVNSIYLVMYKRPIGHKAKNIVSIGDKSRMQTDISYIKTVLERVPKHVREKINIDGCLEDTIKFYQTGFGCSANISRIQVWPDGSVSGCPYAFTGSTPTGQTVHDILENIKSTRQSYDFDRCHLPNVYNSFNR
jgi:hypothetical protein